MSDPVVGEIRKSARERIRVILEDKGGNTACALRIASANARGEIVTTARGLRVPVECLAETITVLQEAERLARACGLLPSEPTVAPKGIASSHIGALKPGSAPPMSSDPGPTRTG